MTRPTGVPVAPGVAGGRARGMVAALAVSQTVGYGALYYSFAVFLTPLSRDLHASPTAVTGALTAATLTAAVAAVPVGAWLDRRGGRGLMTVGSLAGTLLLALMSTVDNLVELYAVWTGIGLVSAMVLYEAAFAVVVAWHPTASGRANALLAITVVAGFASSVFLPLTGALVQAYGWRSAALILAAIHGTITVPLHATMVRRSPPSGQAMPGRAPVAARRNAVHDALHDGGFWLITLAFVASAAAISTMSVHLVAYLIDAGHPATFAATVAGLLGVLSVTGRLATTGLQRRLRTTTVVAAVFALQAVAAACLPIVARTNTGAILAVVGFGLGFGVATIARPALLADRYGTDGYATISGLLTVPMTLAKAGAPLAAAALHGLTRSYPPVVIAVALACAVASAAIAAVPHPVAERRHARFR
jgi:predicted MFS family arabinose efflux permease